MRKSSKIFIPLIVLSSLFFINFIHLPKQASAQGTFNCAANDDLECVVATDDCDRTPPDCYRPEPLGCQGYDWSICSSIPDQECVPTECAPEPPDPEPGTFSCSWNGVSCVVGINRCGPGYHARASLCPQGDQATTPSDCVVAGIIPCVPGPLPQLYRCIPETRVCDETDRQENAYDDPVACGIDCTELHGDPPPTEVPGPPRCDPVGEPRFSGVDTAIGCVPVLADTTQPFITFFLRWAFSIAGGLAFLLILYSGFQMVSSAGNPQKVAASKELLTAAIFGLILLIFSVYVLETIGVRILQLPAF